MPLWVHGRLFDRGRATNTRYQKSPGEAYNCRLPFKGRYGQLTFQNKTIIFPRAPVELLFCCPEHGYHTLSEQAILHPEKLTARERRVIKKRLARMWIRLDCEATFPGSGNWKRAKIHGEELQHKLARGLSLDDASVLPAT